METPIWKYRENLELHREVEAACAYFGTNVSAAIVAHHKDLVRRWKRELAKDAKEAAA